jgi:hypothetical protein
MPKKSGSGDPSELIRMAISRIDDQIGELTAQRTQLEKMVSGGVDVPVARRRGRPPLAVKAVTTGRKKRKVSPATKAKLKAAAKARWARYRADKKASAA